MSNTLRTFLAIASIVLISVFIFFTFFLEGILKEQLSSRLKKTFDNYYSVDFESSESRISWFRLSITFNDVEFKTDTSRNELVRQYPVIFFRAKAFEVTGVHMLDVLLQRDLHISEVKLQEPNLLSLIPDSRPVQKSSTEELSGSKRITSLTFDQLLIEQGQAALVWLQHPEDTLYAGRNLSLETQSFELPLDNSSGQVLKNIHLKDMKMSLKDVIFIPRFSPYRFAIAESSLSLSDSLFTNAGIEALPKRNLYQASLKADYRKTFFNITADSLNINQADFNELIRGNTIQAKRLDLVSPSITLFQNMNLPRDEQVEKLLLGELVNQVPMHLDIDTLDIINLELRYEVLAKGQTKTARVNFSQMDGHFANIRKNDTQKDTIKVELSGRFMEAGDIYFTAQFPLNTPRNHTYSGHIASMPFASFNPIFSNLGKVNISDGAIKHIYFTGTCDQFNNRGQMIFDYEGLKLQFKTKRDRNAWLKTGLANLLVRNNSGTEASGQTESVDYHYVRPPYIGELGFIVHGITDGVAQVVLPKPAYRLFRKK
ncbi:hypothetical protein [Roseivirga sp.]|uniref:hypothetical protein n=1 Tax=Roseivirga sp. TaxID=1964215 RepID=UPI003B52FC7C